jgi:hypothetical protein
MVSRLVEAAAAVREVEAAMVEFEARLLCV